MTDVRLEVTDALVWLPHQEKPRLSTVKGYFEIKRLNRRASPNPYFKGSARRRPGRRLTAIAAASAAAVIAGGVWLSTAAGHNQTRHPTDAPARVDPPKANPPAHGSPRAAKPQHAARR